MINTEIVIIKFLIIKLIIELVMNSAEYCKIVLIGETGMSKFSVGVGKTSIISRFVHNKFESEFMTTLGASYASKSMYIEEYDKMLKFEVKTKILFRFGTLLDRRNIDH